MLTKKGYVIQKKNLNFNQLQELKRELTVTPFSLQGFPQPFPLFRETHEVIRIPRFYGIENYGIPKINKIPDGEQLDIKFHGSLKINLQQDIAATKTIEQLKNEGGALLNLPTGYGKTCVSLYILSELQVKTLILVHKDVLLQQWKERIHQFIPKATVGILKQNKMEIECDIVIGMLQSIALRDYDCFKNFGFVIIDETHHICSKLFSESMFKICPKYILGLSATPFRKDGLTHTLYWFLNKISFSVEREFSTNVNVELITYEDNVLSDNHVKAITELTEDDDRNDLIIKKVIELQAQNRKILILTDRREHCKLLQQNILNSGLYLGGMKQHDLKYNEHNCSVLIGTYHLAQEGLDIPTLDSLILATPKSDIIQACGRILRETEGKINTPLIIDIQDSSFETKNKARIRFYKKFFHIL